MNQNFSPEDLKKMQEKLDESSKGAEELSPEENPVLSIAQSLYMIERHLQAIVYIKHTAATEGLNYIPDHLYQIYEGGATGSEVVEEPKETEDAQG